MYLNNPGCLTSVNTFMAIRCAIEIDQNFTNEIYYFQNIQPNYKYDAKCELYTSGSVTQNGKKKFNRLFDSCSILKFQCFPV